MFRVLACTSAVVLTGAVGACGGGSQGGSPTPTAPTGTPQPAPAPAPLTPSGQNWTFTVAVTRLAGFEGSFDLSGETVTAVLAPFGNAGCFNGDADRASFSGRRSGRTVELQSQPLNGQVIDLSGTLSAAGDVFEGTYSINGGCAHGDRGAARGHAVNLTGVWTGRLGNIPTVIDLRMSDTPDSSAGFTVSGPVRFSGTQCFPDATITRRVRGRLLFPDIVSGTQRLELLGVVSDDLSSMTIDYALASGSCPELNFGRGVLTRQ
jgi:hypothetical protein